MTNLERNQLNFINLRFGTFIHFNSASVQFHNSKDVDDWEFGCENGGRPRKYPFNEKDFAPKGLDTDTWANMAKAAGCRFAALTTKHHEGFCLWQTEATEHSVKNATVKTDVVAKYLESFRKVGIVAGLYFSILDLTEGVSRNLPFTEEHAAFIEKQVTELLTNYGEIPFLMVDGWNSPWGGPSFKDFPFERLDKLVKTLQPNCLLMNIGWPHSLAGTDIAFYENAAGQEVKGAFSGPGVSCNKLTGSWFHRDGDGEKPTKTADWAVEKAHAYFPSNINFMLNISPDENGCVDQNLIDTFCEIGKKIQIPAPLTELPEGWLTRE